MNLFQKQLNFVSKFLLASLLSFVVSFGYAQSTPPVTSGAKANAPAEEKTRGLLFEIKSGKNTAYLFGSIHIAKADFYPMSPKVEQAYKQADTVAVEADTSDMQAVQAIMPKMTYAAPDKLENHLTPATWADFKAVFGMGADQMQMLKPFTVTSALAVQIGMQLGYNPQQGIDLHFIQRAKADKKTLVELESLAFQADVLSSFSDEEGDALIVSLLKSVKDKTMFTDLEKIVTAWKAADANAIAQLFVESGSKDIASKRMTKVLLDDRNEGMVTKINGMMKDGKKLFVVVGAGHLAGEKSIIDLMKKQGLEVRQIR